jgi:hypothetical protein
MAKKFDALSLISPSIGAIGSIVGGFLGKKGSDNAAKIQYRIAQETNANNYRIAQENNAFNERMFDKQNEWNSAKNQRARLEEAGLNPYLMLDGGSAGTATSAPTADTSSVQSIPEVGSTIASGAQQLGSSISSAASQISQQVYNSSLQQANVRKANADASSSEQEALLKGIESQFAAQRFLLDLKLKEMQGKVSEQDYYFLRDSMKDRLDAVKFQNTLTGSQSSYYNQMAGLVDVQRQIEQTNLDWLPREKQAGLAATLQNVRTMVSQMGLNYAMSKNAYAMAALNYAQENGVRIDNRLKNDTYDLAVKMARNQVNTEYWNQKNANLNYFIGNQSYNDSHRGLNPFWRWTGASPGIVGGAVGYTLGKGKGKLNAPKKVKGFRQ